MYFPTINPWCSNIVYNNQSASGVLDALPAPPPENSHGDSPKCVDLPRRSQSKLGKTGLGNQEFEKLGFPSFVAAAHYPRHKLKVSRYSLNPDLKGAEAKVGHRVSVP